MRWEDSADNAFSVLEFLSLRKPDPQILRRFEFATKTRGQVFQAKSTRSTPSLANLPFAIAAGAVGHGAELYFGLRRS